MSSKDKKYIIAIDGYSSTGKSSISKVLAKKLGYTHIDSGAMYRAITLYSLENYTKKDNTVDIEATEKNLNKIPLNFIIEDQQLKIYLSRRNIENEIRNPIVSENVSIIAKREKIRLFLLEKLRNFAQKENIIMDGRDIGTIVFPNADYKFFITANTDERANRRHKELIKKNIPSVLQEVKKNLLERDKTDRERDIAPLEKAKDALLIDNTFMNIEESIEFIYNIIKCKQKER